GPGRRNGLLMAVDTDLRESGNRRDVEQDLLRSATELRAVLDLQRLPVARQFPLQCDWPELGWHVFEARLLVPADPRQRRQTHQVQIARLQLIVDYGEARQVDRQRRGEDVLGDSAAGFAGDVGRPRQRAAEDTVHTFQKAFAVAELMAVEDVPAIARL